MALNNRELLIELKRERLKRKARQGDLLAFTGLTKPDYQINWHHALLCSYLNRFLKREIKRLMVFMPPRHGKSELVSRRMPALIHGLYPNDEILSATYNADLAADMTVDVQRIMDRPIYQELFPHSRITPEGSVSKFARNNLEHELLPVELPSGELQYPKGNYRAQGVSGSFSGRGGNWLLIDDPVKNREDADSKVARETVWRFYTSTFSTRAEGENACILLTMTRWHEDDLAGRLLQKAKQDPEADQWTVLRLPGIRDDSECEQDPRLLGEPLWPAKFGLKFLNVRKSENARDFSALFQQNPVIEGGNIFKRPEFKFYKTVPIRFDQVIISCDTATKDKQSSDYYVYQVWGRIQTDKYLLAQSRGKWSFPMACDKLMALCKSYPLAHKKLIEAKANGPAIVQTLKSKISGLVEIEPRGDKVARAHAVSPEVQGGSVWLPDPEIAPWVEADLLPEVCAFPNAPNDDQVDAMTQALDELRKASVLYMPHAGHGSGTIF